MQIDLKIIRTTMSARSATTVAANAATATANTLSVNTLSVNAPSFVPSAVRLPLVPSTTATAAAATATLSANTLSVNAPSFVPSAVRLPTKIAPALLQVSPQVKSNPKPKSYPSQDVRAHKKHIVEQAKEYEIRKRFAEDERRVREARKESKKREEAKREEAKKRQEEEEHKRQEEERIRNDQGLDVDYSECGSFPPIPAHTRKLISRLRNKQSIIPPAPPSNEMDALIEKFGQIYI